jgi:hypothetical protein
MNRKVLHLAACACLLVGAGAVATNGFGAFAVAAAGDVTACAKKRGKNKGALRLASKCRKGERKVRWSRTGPAGADAVAPGGAVMYFDLPACPAGWEEYTAGRGRYLVGLNSGGTPGAAVGTALGNEENRAVGQHSHGVTDPGHAHSVPYDTDMLENLGDTIGGTDRVGADNATAATSSAPTGITIDPAGAVAGTNAPYVQLLACRKD